MTRPQLHLLPVRTGAAAENMAADFLLLQRYPEPAAPRFRHYGWRREAFTFGYSQKIAFVRANLPSFAKASEGAARDAAFDLCRRPTGGGIVDHRNDWTYTLVIPRGHPLEEERAAHSYRAVHEALAAALTALGQPVELKLQCEPSQSCGSDLGRDKSRASTLLQEASLPGVCFQRAELFDVVNRASGAKVAGAAQKRNKHGLLLQGSIEKSALGTMDWDLFGERFAGELARVLRADEAATPWPELNEDELSGLTEQYSAPEWVEHR
jgi:lipoate-protein ligase A